MSRRNKPILIALVTALLTGCGTTGMKTSLGPPYEPTGAVRADVLIPMDVIADQAGRVRVTDNQGVQHDQAGWTEAVDEGGNPGKHSGAHPGTHPGEHPGAGAEGWRMRVAGFWVVDVVRETAGGVSIVREVELADSRRVEYDPPLPLLPAELKMGEPIESVTQARVYDHGSGTLLSQGTCTAVYRLLGSKQIRLPSRTVVAAIVQTDRRFDLPWVQVDMHILAAYVPGEGAVAWQTRRVVRLFGLLPVTREESAVRMGD